MDLAVSGETEAEEMEEVEGEAGEADTLVTWQKYIIIFVLTVLPFHFSKNVSMEYQPFFLCLL